MTKKMPELLAPAGGMEQLVAAVENGADAVYLGGPAFNARIRADNFTEAQMQAAIDYAHTRNVKVYVTLNILLKDKELLPALEYACRLRRMGADALILQDLGMAALVQQYLPDMPVHFSTQGSIYNLSGVKTAKELGFSRVVLARELSVEEIRTITEAQICDIEVFVHGALCMCYSGQCQMSRVLGDGSRSGNRGLCAQPCRLPYEDTEGERTYALSPKDLCAIDLLGELTEAGVASLKIEGRMKFPEYVAAVVRIYRKYLDLYRDCGSYQVTEEDRRILMQIFSRGSFTQGYLKGNPGEQLLSGRLPKHQGVYAGKVAGTVKGRPLVDLSLKEPLEKGDGIEIHSRELTGNIVTYLQERKNGIVRVGDLKGKVRPGDPVYRISKASLMKELRKTYEGCGPDGTKCYKQVPVEMTFRARIGKFPTLEVKEGKHTVLVKEEEFVTQQAQHRPLEEETVVKQLKKTGNTPFNPSKIEVELQPGASLPAAVINKLRRKALDALSGKKQESLYSKEQPMLPSELRLPQYELPKRPALYFYTKNAFERFSFSEAAQALGVERVRAYVPLQYYVECRPVREKADIIPYIFNISKGKLDAYIEENIEKITKSVMNSGIAIGNLGWMREFVSRGVPVYADYGLNLYNKKTAEVIRRCGAQPVVLSHEQNAGNFPLMVTEHLFPTESLRDRKGQIYKIARNYERDKSILMKSSELPDLKMLRDLWQTADGETRIYVL